MQAEDRVGEREAQGLLSLDLIDTSLKLLATILMGWHILSSKQESWRIEKLNNSSQSVIQNHINLSQKPLLFQPVHPVKHHVRETLQRTHRYRTWLQTRGAVTLTGTSNVMQKGWNVVKRKLPMIKKRKKIRESKQEILTNRSSRKREQEREKIKEI